MYNAEDVKNRCRFCNGYACENQLGDNGDMTESEFRMNSLCSGGADGHLKCPFSQYCKSSNNYRPDLMK